MAGNKASATSAKKKKSGRQTAAVQRIPVYDHPNFEASKETNRVEATIRLASPVCELLDFAASLSPSTTIGNIIQLIYEHHDWDIRDVIVCIHRFHPDETLSADASLNSCGITSGQCVVYYDFAPVTGPLL